MAGVVVSPAGSMGLRAVIRGFLVLLALLLGGSIAVVPPARAGAPLPQASGAPLLTIDGRIAATNAGASAVLDLDLLKSLPAMDLRTATAWTDGTHQFTGVRLRDLLQRLGAEGTTLRAMAVDGYAVDIPVSDARDYDVIVAYAMDGKPLPADDKGPLWIVYPFSQVPALQSDFYFARCIWQLNRLTVQ
jgi:hypothetical protein